MNTPEQIMTGIQAGLKLLQFSDTSLIFGNNVYVVPSIPRDQIGRLITRTAFIAPSGQTHHAEHHEIFDFKFAIGIFSENVRSEFGETNILGDATYNGIKEAEKGILDYLEDLTVLTSRVVVQVLSVSRYNKIIRNFPLFMSSINCSTRASEY